MSVDIEAVASGGWRARVEVVTATGASTRTLESPACETLGDAVVLIAAASLSGAGAGTQAGAPAGPEGGGERGDAGGEPLRGTPEDAPPEPESGVPRPDDGSGEVGTKAEPLTEPAPVSGPVPRPVSGGRESAEPGSGPGPSDDRDERARDRNRSVLADGPAVFVRAEGLAGWGLTPRADLGGGGAVGFIRGVLTVEGFGVALANTQTVDTPGVRVSGWSAGARGCGRVWAQGRVAVPLCGSVEVGQLRGVGVGEQLTRTSEHRDAWVGVAAGPGVRVALGPRVDLRLGAEAVVVARRPAFFIEGIGDVYRARAVGPRLRLGLEIRPFGGRSSLSSTD